MTDTIRTSFKKRATAIAVASCLSFVPWLAEAASLGKITVLSGLGQPLRAEIEISASRAELAGMTARLAGSAAFKEAGIDYGAALLDLRFDIGKRSNGAPVVKVSSTKPENEPFMNIGQDLVFRAAPGIVGGREGSGTAGRHGGCAGRRDGSRRRRRTSANWRCRDAIASGSGADESSGVRHARRSAGRHTAQDRRRNET